jgi:hypothetical protein
MRQVDIEHMLTRSLLMPHALTEVWLKFELSGSVFCKLFLF